MIWLETHSDRQGEGEALDCGGSFLLLPVHAVLNVELDDCLTVKLQALEKTFIHSQRPLEEKHIETQLK